MTTENSKWKFEFNEDGQIFSSILRRYNHQSSRPSDSDILNLSGNPEYEHDETFENLAELKSLLVNVRKGEELAGNDWISDAVRFIKEVEKNEG